MGKSNSFRFAAGLINGESVAAGIIRENDMAELISMMNIGKEMAKRLDSVGIGSAEELVRSGAEQAFLKLKERYPNVCLVHLYAGMQCGVQQSSKGQEKGAERV